MPLCYPCHGLVDPQGGKRLIRSRFGSEPRHMPGDLVPASDTAHPCVVEESPHHCQVLLLPWSKLDLYAELGSCECLYTSVTC